MINEELLLLRLNTTPELHSLCCSVKHMGITQINNNKLSVVQQVQRNRKKESGSR